MGGSSRRPPPPTGMPPTLTTAGLFLPHQQGQKLGRVEVQAGWAFITGSGTSGAGQRAELSRAAARPPGVLTSSGAGEAAWGLQGDKLGTPMVRRGWAVGHVTHGSWCPGCVAPWLPLARPLEPASGTWELLCGGYGRYPGRGGASPSWLCCCRGPRDAPGGGKASADIRPCRELGQSRNTGTDLKPSRDCPSQLRLPAPPPRPYPAGLLSASTPAPQDRPFPGLCFPARYSPDMGVPGHLPRAPSFSVRPQDRTQWHMRQRHPMRRAQRRQGRGGRCGEREAGRGGGGRDGAGVKKGWVEGRRWAV